jgi:hypothetical protein
MSPLTHATSKGEDRFKTYLRTLVTSMDSVSLSHHTVVEITPKIHEPFMQFPPYNFRVLYPRVSSLYETEDGTVLFSMAILKLFC